MASRPAVAYAALVTVQLCFATVGVAGKIALRDLPPLALAAVRVAAGAAALLLLARLVSGPLPAERRDLRTFAVLGFFGVFANQVLFITGLERTSAVKAVLLVATIPAFTYLFAVLRRHQRAGLGHVAGLALSFAGIAVVVGGGRPTPSEMIGDLLVVLNSASYGWYLVISRPVLERHSPAHVIAWAFVFGGLGTVLVAAPTLAGLDWGAVPADAWKAVAFIVAFPTVVAYSLNLYALRALPSRTVAAFVYLQPVGGALLAIWLLDEPLTAAVIGGAALVLLGIGLVVRER